MILLVAIVSGDIVCIRLLLSIFLCLTASMLLVGVNILAGFPKDLWATGRENIFPTGPTSHYNAFFFR